MERECTTCFFVRWRLSWFKIVRFCICKEQQGYDVSKRIEKPKVGSCSYWKRRLL